jgi:hypothetical protein
MKIIATHHLFTGTPPTPAFYNGERSPVFHGVRHGCSLVGTFIEVINSSGNGIDVKRVRNYVDFNNLH